jgi:hypothetical protein
MKIKIILRLGLAWGALLPAYPSHALSQTLFNSKTLLHLDYGTAPGKIGFSKGDAEGFCSSAASFDMDDQKNIYVYDGTNSRVCVFSSAGHFLKAIACPEDMKAMAVEGNGTVYLAHPDYSTPLLARIYQFNPDGSHSVTLGDWQRVMEGTHYDPKTNTTFPVGPPKRSGLWTPRLVGSWDYHEQVRRVPGQKENEIDWVIDPKAFAAALTTGGPDHEVVIPVPKDPVLRTQAHLLGIDQMGDVFVLCAFVPLDELNAADQSIYVYDKTGAPLAHWDVPLDQCLNSADWLFRVSRQGDLYQLVSLKNHVDVEEWSKK